MGEKEKREERKREKGRKKENRSKKQGNYPYIISYRPSDRKKNPQKQERISKNFKGGGVKIFLDGHNIYLVTLFILSVTSLKI